MTVKGVGVLITTASGISAGFKNINLGLMNISYIVYIRDLLADVIHVTIVAIKKDLYGIFSYGILLII
jgi:hypothetical protein